MPAPRSALDLGREQRLPRTLQNDSTSTRKRRAQQLRELAGVHLGHEHALERAQHVAGVGGQRVQVAQVRARDLDARRSRARRTPARIAPSLEPQPSTSSVASGVGVDRQRRHLAATMPATFAARSSVIRAWLAAS